MKKKNHCDLCDNQILDIELGLICAVTKVKPSFTSLCTKINLNNRLKTKLEDVLIEYEYLKQFKEKSFINIYLKLFFGLLIFFCGCFSLKFFYGEGNYGPLIALKYLILVLGITLTTGLYFMKFAISKLVKIKKDFYNAREAKINVDKVLKLYSNKYSYTVNFDEEVHGIQNVNVEIEFF